MAINNIDDKPQHYLILYTYWNLKQTDSIYLLLAHTLIHIVYINNIH